MRSRLLIICLFFTSFSVVQAKDEVAAEESACADALAPNPGQRYARALAALEDKNASEQSLDHAWSDFQFLMKLVSEGSFSFKDEILAYLSDAYMDIPRHLRARARRLLLNEKRSEDLQSLKLLQEKCRGEVSERCSPANLAELHSLLHQWQFGAALVKWVAPIEKIENNPFLPQPDEDDERTWSADAEADEIWSPDDENKWGKVLKREKSDVNEILRDALYPTIANEFRAVSEEADDEVIGLLRHTLFPSEEDWRTGGLDLPEDLFEVIKGNQNPWQSPLLRTLSIAAMIMNRYARFLKADLEAYIAEQGDEISADHPIRDTIQNRAQFLMGFAWMWTRSENFKTDETSRAAWARLQPIVRYVALCEKLLDAALHGAFSDETRIIDPVQEALVGRFIRSNLKESGLIQLLLLRDQTDERLKSRLFWIQGL